jgi:hypothetical protein
MIYGSGIEPIRILQEKCIHRKGKALFGTSKKPLVPAKFILRSFP